MENQNQTAGNEVPENLTPQQALAILVQGVQFAQTKGIYSLTDAELISKAVRVFTPAEEGKEGSEVAATAEAPAPANKETVESNVTEAAPVMELVAEETSAPTENTSAPAAE